MHVGEQRWDELRDACEVLGDRGWDRRGLPQPGQVQCGQRQRHDGPDPSADGRASPGRHHQRLQPQRRHQYATLLRLLRLQGLRGHL